jgi:hypothetical protein
VIENPLWLLLLDKVSPCDLAIFDLSYVESISHFDNKNGCNVPWMALDIMHDSCAHQKSSMDAPTEQSFNQ